MKIQFDQESSSLLITLLNGCAMVQHTHPQTNEPVTALNFEDVAKACVSVDEWDSYLKLKGIEIDGVMCSATAEDQNGLLAVLAAKQLEGDAFSATVFMFANGNSLVISKDNINDVVTKWMPFRQSFFRRAS
jgi:uncharacterized protein YlzI (FlbEa/FlbD family)